MNYQIIYTIEGHPVIVRDDQAQIPADPLNRDFCEFLEWNAKQAQPLDYETSVPPTPIGTADAVVYTVPVYASDFIVASPKVPDDPAAALAASVTEAGKLKKSIAFIALAVVKVLDDFDKRLKKKGI